MRVNRVIGKKRGGKEEREENRRGEEKGCRRKGEVKWREKRIE